MAAATGYVVYWVEHLRDGVEEGAQVFEALEGAKALITKLGNGFAACNLTIRLFELGRELPLKQSKKVVEEKVVVKEVTEFEIGA